jgi:hypothetical protein
MDRQIRDKPDDFLRMISHLGNGPWPYLETLEKAESLQEGDLTGTVLLYQ